MRLSQFRGHSQFIIEISKTAFRIAGAGVQNCLGSLLNFGLLRIGGCGPREVVVNHIFGVAIVALNAATDSPCPCHMHV